MPIYTPVREVSIYNTLTIYNWSVCSAYHRAHYHPLTPITELRCEDRRQDGDHGAVAQRQGVGHVCGEGRGVLALMNGGDTQGEGKGV